MKKLYHGASWYPELWDEEILKQDIEMMKATGINVVRIGEFAWSVIEPEEGKYDLSLFVKVIGWLHENGIDTVMCTPTPTPPVWYSHQHPERMYVDEHGTVMGHGSRQHACTNHPDFRRKAAAITEEIAKAVGRLPGLVAWQLDNEFKAHVAECMCSTCLKLWHEWLEKRYGTVERLNEAWGTKIWSEYYFSFDQVPQPGPTPFLHNSSLRTMYQRFSMEKIAEFADEQATIIRKYSDAPITHNSSIAFHVDNERLFRNLDFTSYDTYASSTLYDAYLINCDLWRNMKRGRPYWIMETSPSCGGSLVNTGNPHPNGYLQAEAVVAYALGAEAFCYWLWRQQRSGSEQPHGSVISAWGKPTVAYPNVLGVSEAKRQLEPVILDTRLKQADVAITYSDRAKAFFKTEPHKGLNHRGLITSFYSRLMKMGIHRDLIPEGADLSGYKILFTPFLPYVSSEFLERVTEFVRQGGIWIAGPLTGGRTEEHTIPTDAGLGAELERLAGVETLYTYPMDKTGTKGRAFGVEAELSFWSSVFKPVEAEAVGILVGGLCPGEAFVTERRLGEGKVVLIGSTPTGDEGNELWVKLIEHYAAEAGVTVRTDATPGTIVAQRTGDGYELWIIVNMDGAGGSVTLPTSGVDVVTNEEVAQGKLAVGRYEYRAIRFADRK